MHAFHYTNYNSYSEALVGFTCYCRDHNLQVGLSHSQEALQAANSGFFFDFSTLKYALGGLFCNTPEEKDIFERCFDTFWGKRKHIYNHKIQNQAKTNVSKKQKASLVMMGFNNSEKQVEETEDAKNVSGASRLESLKKTDFSKISKIEGKELDEITNQLLQQITYHFS